MYQLLRHMTHERTNNNMNINKLLTLVNLAPSLVKLDAPAVLEAGLEAPYVLDVVLPWPVQGAVPVVHVVLEAASVQLLLDCFVPLRLEVKHSLVVALS